MTDTNSSDPRFAPLARDCSDAIASVSSLNGVRELRGSVRLNLVSSRTKSISPASSANTSARQKKISIASPASQARPTPSSSSTQRKRHGQSEDSQHEHPPVAVAPRLVPI